MKYKATVINIDDPDGQGKIKVKMHGFESGADESPWMYPHTPFAGNGYGFWCLPQVGDEVLVEETADGDWIYTGFFWTDRNSVPSDGSATIRIFRTPVGHQLKFDENGNIEVEHSSGATIIMKQDGTIEINGGSGNVVTTESICAFTGAPHPQGSLIVKAGSL